MGQYYIALVTDKNNKKTQKFHPHEFAESAKLTDHSLIGNEFIQAVYSTIHNTPRKVAWIGDYSDEPYDPTTDVYAQALSRKEFMKMYKIAWGEDTLFYGEEGFELNNSEPDEYDTKVTYLVNHDLKCYIDIAAYIERSTIQEGEMKGNCLDPLPLLTACGNNRGCGDFRSGIGFDDVGKWAFHRIECADQIPEGYDLMDCCFIEA
ncbi:MAG: hypothetical protein LBJ11_05525 [Oscillospiraceae bacterium]|jgi:hypothetical protein|nr:hypothetical protein [Oscillospiraceae bacterium]